MVERLVSVHFAFTTGSGSGIGRVSALDPESLQEGGGILPVEESELFIELGVLPPEGDRVFEEAFGHNRKEFGRAGGSIQVDDR
jgi:hypothetical protein